MLTLLILSETPREHRSSPAAISPELQVAGKVIPYRAV
jgi:hypothetical protein